MRASVSLEWWLGKSRIKEVKSAEETNPTLLTQSPLPRAFPPTEIESYYLE
jgi:hypothetical protein